MIAPNTVVHLLNVPIEEDQHNQMDFATASAQATYFISKLVAGQSYASGDFTYQRKDDTIRIPAEYDMLQSVNYVMYQNSYYNNKWFYAFVTKREYLNPNCTLLYIKTDVFQTWQFDWILKQSFVAREHVADDTPYLHTLPEPVPTFEKICKTRKSFSWAGTTPSEFGNNYYVGAYATGCSIAPSSGTVNFCGNVPTPGHMYVCLYDRAEYMFEKIIDAGGTIDFATAIPKDAVGIVNTNIAEVFIAVDKSELGTWGGDAQYQITLDTTTIDYPDSVSYTIRNKKLNCYPYRYLEICDLYTQSVVIRPEDMYGTTFYLHAEQGQTPSFTLYYPSYANEVTFKNSVTVNCFPPIPYSINYYSQYLAINRNMVNVDNMRNDYNLVSSVVEGIGELGEYNIGGALDTITGGVFSKLKRNAMFDDMKSRPPITHNPPTGNVKLGTNSIGMHINEWRPKLEYIKILDDYFDFYGYNVSTVKTPQFTSRSYWNYIETNDINIDGNIPQEDIQELKRIFNSGVTVWHGNSTSNTNWCDYSHINTIVGG